MLLGHIHKAAERITTTGLSPSTVRHPNLFVYTPAPHFDGPAEPSRKGPQPRTCNPCRVSHTYGLAPSAFARHYSRNHFCFLFLRVLRCFTSPRSPQPAYVFSRWSHELVVRGFPIRKSWSQRPVIDSTRLIADSHVLLRLLLPRNPPCALENLATQTKSQ